MSSLKTTNILHPSSSSNNIVLDSSGNFAVQAGTAAAPAIQATGDSNTGIYFPAADNIGFTTGGTIRGRWTTDGLCFNADTAAANALDDYEEGTWTPIVGGTATYSYNTGVYTKVGNFVTLTFILQINTIGTGSTQFISGLPFTPASLAGAQGGSVHYLSSSALNFYSVTMGILWGTSTQIGFGIQDALDGSYSNANQAIIGNSTRIDATLSYRV